MAFWRAMLGETLRDPFLRPTGALAAVAASGWLAATSFAVWGKALSSNKLEKMKLQYNFDLLVVASLGLRRLLDLPTRLPSWNWALSWLWLPAAVVFAVAAPFHYRNKLLDDGYALFAYALLISTLLRLRGYRPARTLPLAVLPVLLNNLIRARPAHQKSRPAEKMSAVSRR